MLPEKLFFPMSASIKRIPCLTVACLLASCVSPKFERAWKGAAQGGGAGQRWEGRWQSERSTHGGRLRAVLREPVNGKMEAFFEAGWHGFTTAYPVELVAVRRRKKYELTGEHRLRSCIGGGTYHYSGTMEPGRFFTNYTSDYDTGSFSLTPLPLDATKTPPRDQR